MRNNLKPRALALAGLVMAAVAVRADAAIIYQSATPAGSPAYNGYTVDSNNSLAARFEVTQPTLIRQIGGEFNRFTAGNLFAALIALSGPTDFPNTTNYSASDVLLTGLISPGSPSADAALTFAPLTLPAGWYAVVFGSGRFGATGSAGLINDNVTVGTPSFYKYSPGIGYTAIDLPGARFFVTDVPEPAMPMLGAAALGVLARRRTRAIPAAARCG